MTRSVGAGLRARPAIQRIGASNPEMAGPLGAQILQLLADPDICLVLDSWLDPDGQAQGNAADKIQ